MDTATATKICIEHIKKDIQYNEKHRCCLNLVPIQKRMLERHTELIGFFVETLQQVPQDRIMLAMEIIPDAYYFWQEGEANDIRQDHDAIEKLNENICQMAGQLATMLDQRQQHLEHTRFGIDVHYDLLDVINDAGDNNYLFQNWVKNGLNKLSDFDSRYWPSVSDCLRSLSSMNRDITIKGRDAGADLIVSQHRASRQDTVGLLLKDLQERSENARYPETFKYSDSVLATIINIGLDLPPEKLFTAEYVKAARQNFRKKGKDLNSR